MTRNTGHTGSWPGDAGHDHLTPAGQVEQAGKFARGLRYNSTGRRRAMRMLAWLGAVIAVGVALVLAFA